MMYTLYLKQKYIIHIKIEKIILATTGNRCALNNLQNSVINVMAVHTIAYAIMSFGSCGFGVRVIIPISIIIRASTRSLTVKSKMAIRPEELYLKNQSTIENI